MSSTWGVDKTYHNDGTLVQTGKGQWLNLKVCSCVFGKPFLVTSILEIMYDILILLINSNFIMPVKLS